MSYFVQCNVCHDYTTASYDAEGFRWMEKHDETCPEPSDRVVTTEQEWLDTIEGPVTKPTEQESR